MDVGGAARHEDVFRLAALLRRDVSHHRTVYSASTTAATARVDGLRAMKADEAKRAAEAEARHAKWSARLTRRQGEWVGGEGAATVARLRLGRPRSGSSATYRSAAAADVPQASVGPPLPPSLTPWRVPTPRPPGPSAPPRIHPHRTLPPPGGPSAVPAGARSVRSPRVTTGVRTSDWLHRAQDWLGTQAPHEPPPPAATRTSLSAPSEEERPSPAAAARPHALLAADGASTPHSEAHAADGARLRYPHPPARPSPRHKPRCSLIVASPSGGGGGGGGEGGNSGGGGGGGGGGGSEGGGGQLSTGTGTCAAAAADVAASAGAGAATADAAGVVSDLTDGRTAMASATATVGCWSGGDSAAVSPPLSHRPPSIHTGASVVLREVHTAPANTTRMPTTSVADRRAAAQDC